MSQLIISIRKKTTLYTIATIAVLLISSCKKNADKDPSDDLNSEMVLTWNKAAIDVVIQTQQAVPNPPIPPFIESRFYAMVNIAMHDALNSIKPKYKRYALLNTNDKDADANAAVAQAAYEVIVSFYGQLNPPAFVTPQPVKDYISTLLQQSLTPVTNAEGKSKGIALGHSAAQAILAKRSTDGIEKVMFPVTEGTKPGEYRFTAPFNGPPFNTAPFSGFYDSPGWGKVTPFGMTSGSQFRPVAPYAVTSAEYTTDFNEVKSLGRYNSSTRTTDQTEIAKFWAESSPQGWNRIATNIIAKKNMDAWKVARLLALLQMSEADAYIGSTECKYFYFFWRPVSAIHLADTDGNPNTAADPEWEVVGWNSTGAPDFRYWPTPPVPDYASAHPAAGGAGAELMKNFFATDDISFSSASTSFPSTRNFTSLSQAATENTLSRIYIGYHFRKSCMAGEQQGRSIGKWIFDHYLSEQ